MAELLSKKKKLTLCKHWFPCNTLTHSINEDLLSIKRKGDPEVSHPLSYVRYHWNPEPVCNKSHFVCLFYWGHLITPTVITPTVITPTLINTSTMHPGCIIISFLIATPNNYRIIARSGYWKYDHDCRKTHQIKRVCGTCYAHKFKLNAIRHEWSYILYFISLTKIKDIVENLNELCFQCSCASMFT